jgi:molecular chaperone GrpE
MSEDTPEDAPETADPEVDVLSASQAEIASLKDQLLRALAEVENVRRRGERNVQDTRAYAIDKFARDLLPIVDSLEKSLEAITPEEREAAGSLHNVVEGVDLTLKLLVETLGRNGLSRVGGKGEAFDPNCHQAVAQIPSDAPAGAIAEVFQYGYVLSGRTLRPAMVAVSAGGVTPSAPPPSDEPPPEGKIDIKV